VFDLDDDLARFLVLNISDDLDLRNVLQIGAEFYSDPVSGICDQREE
jgi:hypothetical protein